jgi:hypothetical protein
MNNRKYIEEMTHHYIVAALWSSNDESTPEGGEPLDNNYTPEDLAREAKAQALKDCRKFAKQNAKLLENMKAEHAGHDFWLTRNGHGCGFWDRDLGEVGNKLTDACKKFGGCDAYVGDDGKIYLQ